MSGRNDFATSQGGGGFNYYDNDNHNDESDQQRQQQDEAEDSSPSSPQHHMREIEQLPRNDFAPVRWVNNNSESQKRSSFSQQPQPHPHPHHPHQQRPQQQQHQQEHDEQENLRCLQWQADERGRQEERGKESKAEQQQQKQEAEGEKQQKSQQQILAADDDPEYQERLERHRLTRDDQLEQQIISEEENVSGKPNHANGDENDEEDEGEEIDVEDVKRRRKQAQEEYEQRLEQQQQQQQQLFFDRSLINEQQEEDHGRYSVEREEYQTRRQYEIVRRRHVPSSVTTGQLDEPIFVDDGINFFDQFGTFTFASSSSTTTKPGKVTTSSNSNRGSAAVGAVIDQDEDFYDFEIRKTLFEEHVMDLKKTEQQLKCQAIDALHSQTRRVMLWFASLAARQKTEWLEREARWVLMAGFHAMKLRIKKRKYFAHSVTKTQLQLAVAHERRLEAAKAQAQVLSVQSGVLKREPRTLAAALQIIVQAQETREAVVRHEKQERATLWNEFRASQYATRMYEIDRENLVVLAARQQRRKRWEQLDPFLVRRRMPLVANAGMVFVPAPPPRPPGTAPAGDLNAFGGRNRRGISSSSHTQSASSSPTRQQQQQDPDAAHRRTRPQTTGNGKTVVRPVARTDSDGSEGDKNSALNYFRGNEVGTAEANILGQDRYVPPHRSERHNDRSYVRGYAGGYDQEWYPYPPGTGRPTIADHAQKKRSNDEGSMMTSSSAWSSSLAGKQHHYQHQHHLQAAAASSTTSHHLGVPDSAYYLSTKIQNQQCGGDGNEIEHEGEEDGDKDVDNYLHHDENDNDEAHINSNSNNFQRQQLLRNQRGSNLLLAPPEQQEHHTASVFSQSSAATRVRRLNSNSRNSERDNEQHDDNNIVTMKRPGSSGSEKNWNAIG